ncbi:MULTISPECIES: hypothetical protein [Niastella]|uniref:Uncharacterized protein n=1 Tax=Niastella soli TaxID=2821487 RepID=A0ABS3Z471_9BACT|nr:hypothetical protein [Niastella soli]MBO9204838.1 hypothetical protein [Niastella soli]
MKKNVELLKRQWICFTIGVLSCLGLAAQDPIWDANKDHIDHKTNSA